MPLSQGVWQGRPRYIPYRSALIMDWKIQRFRNNPFLTNRTKMTLLSHRIFVPAFLICLLFAFLHPALVLAQWAPTAGPMLFGPGTQWTLGEIFDITDMVNDSGDTLIIAATGRGTFSTSDYGTTWNLIDSGLTESNETLCVNCFKVNGNELLAGTRSSLFHSTDYGKSWIDIGQGALTKNIYEFVIINVKEQNKYIFIATAANGVSLSTDNGATWANRSSGLPLMSDGNCLARCLAVIPDTLGYSTLFSGTYNGVYKSTDYGLTWVASNNGLPINNSSEWRVGAMMVGRTKDDEYVLFASTPDGLYKSINQGLNWEKAMTGMDNKFFVYCILTDAEYDDFVFIGTNMGMYYSTNQGENWIFAGEGLPSYYDRSSVTVLLLANSVLFAGIGPPTTIVPVVGVWKRSLEFIASGVEPDPATQAYYISSSYPNPVTSGAAVNIEYTLESASQVTLSVFDMLGRMVYSAQPGRLEPGRHTQPVSTSGLKPGVYMYRIVQSGGNAMAGKIVVR